MIILWILVILASVAAIVWGAETFAEHLGMAAVRLRISMFALSLLLAGAEPEELATAVAAALKDVPGIAFGDVIGANIAICLVALGVGALIAPLPFGKHVRRYALLSVPLGVIATGFVWDGQVDRVEGALLVGLYILYVAMIWSVERHPPTLGETEEIEEVQAELATTESSNSKSRVSKDILLVLAGVIVMAVGATLLVEAVRQISNVEETQTKLGLTLIGFATAFELVVLAWSSARRGISEAVVAGVVGSFAYNVTMTLGTAAIVRPLQVLDADHLHRPLLLMLASLILVILLAVPQGFLNRISGSILLTAYPLVVIAMLIQ
ncbi:MAG: sodium:calcium antiporter [Chroococcidiopsidaceae cyanobacterium CP_BM_RX_35]|nr:sodium:calcium antiporter [Chroococcidiopsidaceae cyanobacterium CP_BM_RX_35]